MRQLDVVLKVADRCNLACPYCYYFFKENQLHKDSAALISKDTVRAVGAFLSEAADSHRLERVFVGLHGGEPLLLPPARLEACCMEIREALEGRADVQFALQTNGVLINEDWIGVFERQGIHVGVSLDGPKAVNDRNRPDHKGRGSYDKTVAGLRKLQQAYVQGRITQPGVLCVADVDTDGAETVRHLVEDLGVVSLDLLLPREGHESTIVGRQADWIAYFNGVLKYWVAVNRQTPVTLRLFSDILGSFAGEAAAAQRDTARSNRHNILTIMADGGLGIDDNVMALDARLATGGMNVREHSLGDFLATDVMQELMGAVGRPPEACSSCEWFRVCRGGELYNRFSRSTGFDNPSVFCPTLKTLNAFFARVASRNGLHIQQVADLLNTTPVTSVQDLRNLEPATA